MQNETKYWYLHNHQLFKNLSTSEIESLYIHTNMLHSNKNDIIYLPNEEPRVYVLKKGIIKIIDITESGEQITKDIIQQGDLFGEITLSNDTTRSSSEMALAVSSTVVMCSFFIKDFEKILLAKPDLSLQYTKWVGFKLTKLRTRYADLINKDVEHRLNKFLEEYATNFGVEKNGKMLIKNVLTQKDIAGIIGATRQTVASLIAKLEASNKIVYGRSEIIINNWPNIA